MTNGEQGRRENPEKANLSAQCHSHQNNIGSDAVFLHVVGMLAVKIKCLDQSLLVDNAGAVMAARRPHPIDRPHEAPICFNVSPHL